MSGAEFAAQIHNVPGVECSHVDGKTPSCERDAAALSDWLADHVAAAIAPYEAVIERLCGCAPDCAERIVCTTSGVLGHFACGWCETHDRPRHKCGCTQ